MNKATTIAVYVFFYLAVTFWQWDFNPAHWGMFMRFMYVAMSTAVCVVGSEADKRAADCEDEDNEDEK
jgi:hypothetical protein